jgi:flap endonuclease-1
MGLDGFKAYIVKKYPDIIINEHITLYSHQRVFMDISSYIYKYITTLGTQNSRWINCILQMFLSLKSYKVHVVPVFDGKPPEEKKEELEDRKEKRQKIKDKIKKLEEAIQNYKNKTLSEEDNTYLLEIIKDLQSKNKSTKLKSLLFKVDDEIEVTDNDILDIENYISFSLNRNMYYMGSKEVETVKELLNVIGIPFIQAPDEAETLCCYLCKQGFGTAVISRDTDCFAHGCPNTILDYEPSSGMITSVRLDDLLTSMEFTHDEFIDFAILIGCDYNKKSKLKGVGTAKAFELITQFRKIEDIVSTKYDIANLEYKHIRPLFKKTYEKIKVKKHKSIDRDALESFIDEYNLNININRLDNLIDQCEKEPELQFE